MFLDTAPWSILILIHRSSESEGPSNDSESETWARGYATYAATNVLTRSMSSCSDLRCAATFQCILREEFRTEVTCHAFQPPKFTATLPTQGSVAVRRIFRFSTHPGTQKLTRSSNRFCHKSFLPLFGSPAFRTAFFIRSTISSAEQRAWTKEYSQCHPSQSMCKDSVLSDVILLNFGMSDSESSKILIEARLGR